MVLGRLTTTQHFRIKQPRWHDRKVLLAAYRVGIHNSIEFTHAPTMEGIFYVSGEVAKAAPLVNNGSIDCYAIDLNKLEPLERES